MALDVRSATDGGLMTVSYEDKIKEQALQYLEADEHVLAAFVARPRGATTAMAGGLGPGSIGGMKIAKQKARSRRGRAAAGQPDGAGAYRQPAPRARDHSADSDG